MHIHTHVVTNSLHHFLCLCGKLPSGRQYQCLHLVDRGVDDLADGEGDHGCLPRAGLRLGDDVASGDDGEHGALLDGGGLVEAVAVDAVEEVVADLHDVEAGDRLDACRGLEGFCLYDECLPRSEAGAPDTYFFEGIKERYIDNKYQLPFWWRGDVLF